MGYSSASGAFVLLMVCLAALRPSSPSAEAENATHRQHVFPPHSPLTNAVPQQLLSLTQHQPAAHAVETLALCAARDDGTGAACSQALAVWLAEEIRRTQADADSLHSVLWYGQTTLGVALWKWLAVGATIACYSAWSYIVWLVLGIIVIAMRLLAGAIQGLLLGLALSMYGVAAIARSVASVYANLSQHTRRQQIEELDQQLAWHACCETGTTYEEWRKIAEKRDELSGAAAWRKDDHGWEAVRKQEEQLRRHNNAAGLMFALQPLMKRPAQAEPAVAMAGARHVSDRQSKSMLAALKRIADAPEEEINLGRKLQFFNSSQLALGHTALCLSGGGSLAMYHMGVVRALLEQRMLPRVISGTSGGSIVAGFLAQRTDEELLRDVCVDTISTCLPERWFPPLHEQVASFIQHGFLVKSTDFEACARAYFGDMTFEEGYLRTGRHVNISIASSTRGGQGGASVLLNHITTPNVLIYSAVAASCSLPGIMRAATLMAKDASGRIVPMDPPGTKYVDGSLRADLPLHRLSQLFHVSQFIVSQVNPHIAPFLETPAQAILSNAGNRSGVVASLAGLQRFMFREVQHRCRALAALNMLPTFFGEDAAGVFQQRYHGCLTIVPRLDIRDCMYRVITNPSPKGMRRFINEGRLKTWESLQGIRLLLDVELALEEHRKALQLEMDERVALSPRCGFSEPSRSCTDLTSLDRTEAPPPSLLSYPSLALNAPVQRLGSDTSCPQPSPVTQSDESTTSSNPTLLRDLQPHRLGLRPTSRLPKASSWAHGLSEISTAASRRSNEAALWRERIEENADEASRPSWLRASKGYSSPPPLPARSLPSATAPALRHIVPTLCRALWAPSATRSKSPAATRRYSTYS